jgi:hypothetical protein
MDYLRRLEKRVLIRIAVAEKARRKAVSGDYTRDAHEQYGKIMALRAVLKDLRTLLTMRKETALSTNQAKNLRLARARPRE